MSGHPIEITSVSQWNTTLRSAKAAGETVIVDFHAEWCGPCKQIAPVYANFAAQNPTTHFLRVDVEGTGTRAIAAKYKISAMPTFIAIKADGPIQTIQGADPQGLYRMIATHGTPKRETYSPPSALPFPEAEVAKKAGNDAFAAKDYREAVTQYTKAIELVPESARGILYANRALTYIRLIQSKEPSVEERKKLRPKAIQDATYVTNLEERWGKGWVRMAEALLLAGDEEGLADADGDKEEGRKATLLGAEEALENAIGLSDGKLRAEAQKMLEELRKQIKA